MTILWGHRAAGGKWVDGTVLDPENGKEYRSTVWLDDEPADALREALRLDPAALVPRSLIRHAPPVPLRPTPRDLPRGAG